MATRSAVGTAGWTFLGIWLSFSASEDESEDAFVASAASGSPAASACSPDGSSVDSAPSATLSVSAGGSLDLHFSQPSPVAHLAHASALVRVVSADVSLDLHFSQPSPVAHLAHVSPLGREVSVRRDASASGLTSVWASELLAGADCQHPPPHPAVSRVGLSEDPPLAFWNNSLEQPAIKLKPKPNAIQVVTCCFIVFSFAIPIVIRMAGKKQPGKR